MGDWSRDGIARALNVSSQRLGYRLSGTGKGGGGSFDPGDANQRLFLVRGGDAPPAAALRRLPPPSKEERDRSRSTATLAREYAGWWAYFADRPDGPDEPARFVPLAATVEGAPPREGGVPPGVIMGDWGWGRYHLAEELGVHPSHLAEYMTEALAPPLRRTWHHAGGPLWVCIRGEHEGTPSLEGVPRAIGLSFVERAERFEEKYTEARVYVARVGAPAVFVLLPPQPGGRQPAAGAAPVGLRMGNNAGPGVWGLHDLTAVLKVGLGNFSVALSAAKSPAGRGQWHHGGLTYYVRCVDVGAPPPSLAGVPVVAPISEATAKSVTIAEKHKNTAVLFASRPEGARMRAVYRQLPPTPGYRQPDVGSPITGLHVGAKPEWNFGELVAELGKAQWNAASLSTALNAAVSGPAKWCHVSHDNWVCILKKGSAAPSLNGVPKTQPVGNKWRPTYWKDGE